MVTLVCEVPGLESTYRFFFAPEGIAVTLPNGACIHAYGTATISLPNPAGPGRGLKQLEVPVAGKYVLTPSISLLNCWLLTCSDGITFGKMSDFPKGGDVQATRAWLDKEGFEGVFENWKADALLGKPDEFIRRNFPSSEKG